MNNNTDNTTNTSNDHHNDNNSQHNDNVLVADKPDTVNVGNIPETDPPGEHEDEYEPSLPQQDNNVYNNISV